MAPTHSWRDFAKASLQFQEFCTQQFQHLEKETANIPILAVEMQKISEQLKGLRENLSELRQQLFGNGQPGVLAEHGKAIEEQKNWRGTADHRIDDITYKLHSFSPRIAALEKFRYAFYGALAVIMPLLGLLLWALRTILAGRLMP